jgi:hypothetical protein
MAAATEWQMNFLHFMAKFLDYLQIFFCGGFIGLRFLPAQELRKPYNNIIHFPEIGMAGPCRLISAFIGAINGLCNPRQLD